MLIIIALFMMAIPFLEPDAPDTGNPVIYMGMFFLVFVAAMYLILRYTRLVLSADGIKLYQFGYKLETDCLRRLESMQLRRTAPPLTVF